MPCLLSLLPALGLTVVHAPAPKGHPTPQACFRAYMAADDSEDFTAYVACLTDDAVAVRNAYLLYWAAYELRAKRDPAGELLRVLEQQQVAAQPLDTWYSALDYVQKFLKSTKTAEDWKKYNEAAKALSAPLKYERGFAIDVMRVLHKNRPLRTG